MVAYREVIRDTVACYGVLRFFMESGAKGCEVIVNGKLRAARAKSMKFKDGYMVSSGQPTKEYTDSASVLGIKVKAMLDWDPKGVLGPKTPLPDVVIIHAPKEEDVSSAPAQGVLGIKVKAMLDWDPKGVLGPKTPLPDVVIIHAPTEEDVSSAPAQVAAPAAFYQKHPSQP
uniref:Small ribosomal subunit protein uS3 C-terminal domain-containing protein n=1 Tax=Brassica oleracea var. oleracea TaxID=109376 RepID=A0A0D3BT13_BRAOL